MKSYLVHGLVFLAALSSGIVTSFYSTQLLRSGTEQRLEELESVHRVHAQSSAYIYMGNIEAAENQSYEGLIRMNCAFLRSELPHIRPELAVTAAQRQRITKQLEAATQMVERLEDRDLCRLP